MDESKGFIRSSMILLVTSTIAAAISYLFQFGMGRLLGPADYGILAVFFSILYVMQAPMQAVQLTITKFVAEFRAKSKFSLIKDFLMRSDKKIFLISLIIFFIFTILNKQIASFLNISDNLLVISFGFIFIGLFVISCVRGFLQGMQKFKALGFNLISESVIKLIASLTFIFSGFGVAGAVWGTNISIFLAFLLAFALLFKLLKKYESQHLNNEEKSKIYSYSIPMLIALSSITALYSLDVILVKHFFTATDAGIYAAASLVAKVIFFALMPISQVMFPKIAELEMKKQKYTFIFLKSVLLVAGLSMLAILIYFIEPKFVLNFLFGAEYIAAVPLIGIFGIAISLMSICYVFVNYFLAIGKTGFVYVLPAFPVAEVILIWFIHGSFYQVLTLITAVMASMLIVSVIFYLFSKNETVNSNPSI